MKYARVLLWALALLPSLTAGYWVSFASRWPEPVLDRTSLRECVPAWRASDLTTFVDEPAHVLARLLHLATLQVPGATLASVAWLNALLALLVVGLVLRVARRSLALPATALAFAAALVGLLIMAPAFGVDWLYGERCGLFLPPLLLMLGLSLAADERGSAWRRFACLLIAGVAPFCHAHGMLVFLALIPVVHASARRSGSARGSAWIVSLLLVGNVAAFVSWRSADGPFAAGTAWLQRFAAETRDTSLQLAARFGSTFGDLVPSRRADDVLLAAAVALLLLLLWRGGDRSEAARDRAAPWWSCVWFGVLLVTWDTLRYDHAPPVGTWREATFGAFCLPIGLLGVLASRCGMAAMHAAAGALLLLAVQDWHRGVEALRLARVRVEQIEVSQLGSATASATNGHEVAAPAPITTRTREDQQLLQSRGWVPPPVDLAALVAATVMTAAPELAFGSCHGADRRSLQGTVRSSLRNDGVQIVLAAVQSAGGAVRLVAQALPTFAGAGRNVPWHLDLTTALVDGDRLRALGFVPRQNRLVPLGPVWIVQNGGLRQEAP